MPDSKTLERIQYFIDEINSTNKVNDKIRIMDSYYDLKHIFKLIWDPNLKFHVTPDSLKKRLVKFRDPQYIYTGNTYPLLIDLLKYLTKDETTSSNHTRDIVLHYICANIKHANLIYLIMDKNKKLKIGMGVKTVQKVFPNLFHVFNVSLGVSMKNARKYFQKSIEGNEKWFISRKYDGVRTIIICTGTLCEPIVKAYSRQGNQAHTIEKIITYIITYVLSAYIHSKEELKKDEQSLDLVLDGEIIVMENNQVEDFTKAVSQFRRKNMQMADPHYKVFDILTIEEFYKPESSSFKFSYRTKKLNKVLSLVNETVKKHNSEEKISSITQYKYTGDLLEKMIQQYQRENWEGLILRKDFIYKGKRSNDIIKIKKTQSVELQVIKTINGTQPTMQNGVMKEEEVLASAVVDYKGIQVSVGTGFSLLDKRKYYNQPEKIIGKTIRIDYMEETADGSLRHPAYKGIVGELTREV